MTPHSTPGPLPDSPPDSPPGSGSQAPRRSVRHLALAVLRSRAGRVVGLVVVPLPGGWMGLTAAGSVAAPIGPAQTRLSVAWNDQGDVDVRTPPLGSIELDTHDGPLAVDI